MPVYWFDNQTTLVSALRAKLQQADTVLDIGPGIRPQDYMVPAVHICCEPFGQYVQHLIGAIRDRTARQFRDRRYVVVQATWDAAVELFPAQSVDTVFVLDVIEHLLKEDGVRLLKATESIAAQQLVIFTPLGFIVQEHPDGKDAWGMDGGLWQDHRSGWMPEDFDATWDVLACRNFHYVDNKGVPFDSPKGAFFAVKTTVSAEERVKRAASAESSAKVLSGWQSGIGGILRRVRNLVRS